jgi:predicted nucleotidyltransferase
MSLKEIREGELKDVFSAIEQAFKAIGIDFYIIGAIARDVWYAKGNKSFRRTKDVDFAVMVGSQEEYLALRKYLKEHYNFQDTKQNAFVMFAPGNILVDILPFGEIEINDAIDFKGQGLTSIKVNGFSEVYQSGTTTIELLTGHNFKIATLPSIVLLKLIAFDDRPEHRTKDARDIANIIDHFFDLQADLIYETHVDLFEDENDQRTLQDISAIVIGREIKQICAGNNSLLERVQNILKAHVQLAESSSFIRNMVEETKRDVGQCAKWLANIFSSLTQ